MSRQIGSRNPYGFADRLQRVGVTRYRAGGEINANSSDAGSPFILWKLPKATEPQLIRGIDVGKGMTSSEVDHMFDAERENHALDQSMGVSGIGSLFAHHRFSNDSNGKYHSTGVITKSIHGEYQKAIIPWSEIMNRSITYDGSVTVTSPSQSEIEEFKKEREGFPMSGVTHLWPYSDGMDEMLELQYSTRPSAKVLPFEDRWSITFGKIDMDIILDRNDGAEPRTLPKYDYMGGSKLEYYGGKKEHIIQHHEDQKGNDRFTWLNPTTNIRYEIPKQGKGFAKEISEVRIPGTWKKKHGEYVYTTGMRKDPRVFNEDAPQSSLSGIFYLNPYDAEFFMIDGEKDILKEFCSKMALVRNDQVITHLTLEGVNVGNARANADSLMEIIYHRSELSYYTLSVQGNRMDKAMGIQQTKSQHEGTISKNLERLLIALKKMDLERIKTHFNTCIARTQKRSGNARPQRGDQDVPQPAVAQDDEKEQEAPQSAGEAPQSSEVEPQIEQEQQSEEVPQSEQEEQQSEQEQQSEEVPQSSEVELQSEEQQSEEQKLEEVPQSSEEAPQQVHQVQQQAEKNPKEYHRLKYQLAAAILQKHVHYLIQESNSEDFSKEDGDQVFEQVQQFTS